MRNIQHVLFGLSLVGVVLGGCTGIGGSAGEPVATSEARLTVSAQGSASASLHVTATDDATGEVAIDRTVDVAGGSASVLVLDVAPASYTFAVQAFADAQQQDAIGSGSAQADLAAGAVTEIALTATNAAGGSGGVTIA